MIVLRGCIFPTRRLNSKKSDTVYWIKNKKHRQEIERNQIWKKKTVKVKQEHCSPGLEDKGFTSDVEEEKLLLLSHKRQETSLCHSFAVLHHTELQPGS